MKQRMQGMIVGVLATVLLLGTVTVFAAATDMIEVTFGNIRTTLWGNEFVVRDDNDLVIEPLMYEGRAYFPVETILRAMGSNAQWNEDSKTLNFGAEEQPQPARERVPLRQAAPFFDRNPNFDIIPINLNGVGFMDAAIMGGTGYSDVLVFKRDGFSTGINFTLHNINREYSQLTGHIGRVDGTGMTNVTFNVIGDGRVLYTRQINATSMPTAFSVSVEGVQQLRLEVVFPNLVATQYAVSAFLE